MAITVTAPPPSLPIGPYEDLSVFVRATPPALKRVVISAEFPGAGRTEQIANNATLSPPYDSSLRQPFTDAFGTGFSYTIRRQNGWPDGPVIRVVAYDTAGNEVIV